VIGSLPHKESRVQDDHDDTDTPAGTRSMRRWRRCMPGRSRVISAPRCRTLGGQDPLDGISVYWADAPVPHWHYITYGFSELYAKESSDAAASGYGFRADLPPRCRSR
jgi:hypothetical protein